MWQQPAFGEVTAEPVALAQAKRQCRVVPEDTSLDDHFAGLIATARDHVEKYCGMHFAERTVTLACSEWSDLSAIPVAPLKSVATIKYRDEAGEQRTVSGDVYAIVGTRFSPAIDLNAGQEWPTDMAASGSAIELAAVVGGNVPPSVRHAMLMLIAHLYAVRESVNVGNIVTTVPMAFDDLLVNDRRGIYA
jgi:uncharacterized phiE125 gp8 family phage protein